MTTVNTAFPKVQAAAKVVNGFEQVNEGVFLSEGEFANLEAHLTQAEATAETLASVQTQLQEANTNLQTVNEQLATANARIAELEKKDGGEPATPAANASDAFATANNFEFKTSADEELEKFLQNQ